MENAPEGKYHYLFQDFCFLLHRYERRYGLKKKLWIISHTGSVRTGKIIQEVAAKKLIPTTLELGGKDPLIVFKDANLKLAAKGAIWGAFTNSGQVCMSAERIYVEESIYDDFLNIVKIETEKLIQGTDKTVTSGR